LSLVLFDLDGTLLLSGGAGVRAMTRAFEAVFDVPNALDGILVSGRTDTYIVSRALALAGLPDTPDAHAALRQQYLGLLAEEIQRPGAGRSGAMPGVERLLRAMQDRAGFHAALLTGNYEPAARIKLDRYALGGFFTWGAFGDEAADRNELARIAVSRAAERAVPIEARSRAVVIGDTPHDIECARAAGVRAVAVATGPYSVEQLEAAGADATLRDLSDTAAVLELLR
jgi:phosphoglycolate phosphatase